MTWDQHPPAGGDAAATAEPPPRAPREGHYAFAAPTELRTSMPPTLAPLAAASRAHRADGFPGLDDAQGLDLIDRDPRLQGREHARVHVADDDLVDEGFARDLAPSAQRRLDLAHGPRDEDRVLPARDDAGLDQGDRRHLAHGVRGFDALGDGRQCQQTYGDVGLHVFSKGANPSAPISSPSASAFRR